MNASGSFSDPNAPVDTDYYNTDVQHDFAILPYQHVGGHSWSGYWLDSRSNRNYVESYCVSPTAEPCSGTEYDIIGMYTHAQIQAGWVVCATGSGTAAIYPSHNTGYNPGTRCGEVERKDMEDYDSAWPWGRAIKVNICGRHGDSGGPLFGQGSHKAYGIPSGGPTRSGACDLSSSSEYSVYSALSEILTKANSQLSIDMSLITTSNG